jgi:orotate phosphoribosyltransferase-like protein
MRAVSSKMQKKKDRWAARRARALAMRNSGLTFKEIADKLGVSRGRAEQLVNRAIRDAAVAQQTAEAVS